jgi:hypothetical protein
MGENTDIRYSLDMPPLTDLILKPSFGALAEVEAGPFFGTLGYLYKTVPQPVLALQSTRILNLKTQTLDAAMRPQTVQHHVFSAELGLGMKGRFKEMRGIVSLLWDSPEPSIALFGWTTQRLAPGGWLGLTYEYAGLGPVFRVAYLQSFLGVQSDVGLLAPSGYQSLFGNRYPYRSALSFEVRGKLFELNKQSLSLYARYLHDFSAQGPRQ